MNDYQFSVHCTERSQQTKDNKQHLAEGDIWRVSLRNISKNCQILRKLKAMVLLFHTIASFKWITNKLIFHILLRKNSLWFLWPPSKTLPIRIFVINIIFIEHQISMLFIHVIWQLTLNIQYLFHWLYSDSDFQLSMHAIRQLYALCS